MQVKKILNSKGFNLFSALVAAIILMTSVVLVNMLVTTEETLNREVYIMTNNFNLSDAASIARSDALQTFNYNFRKRLEDYLTVTDNQIENNIKFNIIKTNEIVPGSPDQTWNNIKNEFETSILLSGNVDPDGRTNDNFTAVIKWVSERTIQQFHEGSYGKYNVSLSSNDREAISKLENALNETIEANKNDIEFLEIVGCDYANCDIGTFYFIIPLDLISDEAYESLPLIVVKDLVSGEEIKFPILPRSRLNIYVPVRFFKAIHSAWLYNTPSIIEFESFLELRGEGLKTGMLGYCDAGCEPRKHPLLAGGATWNKKCLGGVRQDVTDQDNVNLLLQNKSYEIGQRNGVLQLTAFVRVDICSRAEQDYASIGYETYRLGDNFKNYNLEEARGHPLTSGINKYEGCPFNVVRASSKDYATKSIDGVASGNLFCSSIQQVETVAIFEDTNPMYNVSGERNRFSIGILSKEFPTMESDLGTCRSTETECKKL
jgi:hypothetical protein